MRHFVAVAEERRFGRAAARLNIAQPPLSQSIQRLEAELGVNLLDRSRRSVELTAAGKIFLREARRTLQLADMAITMTKRSAFKAPEVRISFIGPALYQVLPSLLTCFRQEHLAIEARLFEHASTDQIAGICNGKFDIGIIGGSIARPDDFEALVIERTSLVAMVPADGPLAGHSSISLAELAEYPFVLPPDSHHVQSIELMQLFEREGVVPRVTQEAMQTNTLMGLVAAGFGCGIVSATAALQAPKNIKFIPLAPGPATASRELVMVWQPATLSKAASAFLAAARSYMDSNPKLLDPLAPVT
jgi:DNA-binding transcriptional LysR family regulator